MSTLVAAPRVTARPAPSDPAAPLWCGRNKSASGYRNVYRDRDLYRVRVCKHVNLNGRWPTPHAAACALAAWYAAFYAPLGCDWVKAARNRRKNLGRVCRTDRGDYLAHVFVLGRPVLVSDDFGNANLPSHVHPAGLPIPAPAKLGRWRWADRRAARAAVREWVARFRASLGARRRFAGLYLWRA